MAKIVTSPLTVYADGVSYSVTAGTPLDDLNDTVKASIEANHSEFITDPDAAKNASDEVGGAAPFSATNPYTDGLNPLTNSKAADFTRGEQFDLTRVSATADENSAEVKAAKAEADAQKNPDDADKQKAADEAAKAKADADKAKAASTTTR